ncbi:protein O-linked-mannose beta-1,4-N-acetylglucosaminyltransferase 2-like [Panicum miliaceum]|uniref:Protein O-linked-mannose beta-1,4-N-acetylglucosaminyltransferase 2-like n=1 Tax=Panicum miliaceum TaxID=4540 RepID=A0A3L6PRH1_PANMI|nr:protein O-linked-mannose beta-1,4-N-acetylglucosaminyltransferase 2-like [Panicum miliaceum]
MAASKLAVPKGLGAVEDAAAAKNKPRWGFVQFFFVLSVVLCVLLYAPRVFVLAPRGIDVVGFFTPNSSKGTSSSSSSGSSVLSSQSVGGTAGDDGGRLVLDNQVHSPCSSMRDHTICCDRSSVHTDVCFMAGDVRTGAASLSLLLFPPHDHHQHQAPPNGTSSTEEEERVRPYPRKWERLIMAKVPEVRLRVARPEEEAAAEHRCDVRHDAPLLVMSAGGYTGNLFHAFNDGFLPSWLTVQHLRRRVVLGVLSYNPWWAGTFSEIISGLSDYHVVDLVHDKRTHCFPGAIVGTRFHGVLVVDPARLRDNKTIVDFHQLLADAYETKPKAEQQVRSTSRPRLGIVSRKGTRVIENQAAVARLASSIGFDVDVLETATGLPLSAWYASVSACDALVGVHGADLTKFLFLRPGRASLTQIAPLGVSAIARDCFGGPAARMGVAYEQYEVGGEESSLARRYAADDVVVADPERAKREKGGWGLVARVYLGGQNVSLDLGRFGETLARLHAHALLQRRQESSRR